MKNKLVCLILFLVLSTLLPGYGQENFRKIIPENTSSAIRFPSRTIEYSWDTLSFSWKYKFNAYIQYFSDTLQVLLYQVDTVNNTPVLHDTTTYDSLGRLQMNYYQ